MKESVSALIQYGAIGIMLIGMGWYILFLHKERKKERQLEIAAMDKQKQHEIAARQEQTAAIEKQFDRTNEIADNQTEAMKEMSSILSSLKTLLEMDIKMKK